MIDQVSWEEQVKAGAYMPDSGTFEFDLHYSTEYLMSIGWTSLMTGDYPREGGLENQDPLFLRDRGTMYLMKERILTDLREEGKIKQWQEMGKNNRGK